jgi:putative heme-binding domain-containing protein
MQPNFGTHRLQKSTSGGYNRRSVDLAIPPAAHMPRLPMNVLLRSILLGIGLCQVYSLALANEPDEATRAKEAAMLAEVKAPAEFEAKIFAAPPMVNYPVFLAASPSGDVYVSVDKNGSLGREPNRGSVVRLRDTDGDGRADEVRQFVPSVDSPRGLVWDRDRLYLMHPPHLSAYIDKDGDGVAEVEQVLVKNIAFTFKDRPADHTSNGVTLGIDGWLYLAIGDFGFLEAEGADGTKLQFRSGGVVRVRTDGTGLEVYSRGTRNILEVGLDPLLNGFARDNTNDGGGWDIRLHHFTGMEQHGYPSLFKNFAEEIVAPLADYGGGSGCGAVYVSEPGFPAGYGDALYTADWGRERVFRHRFTPSGATFTADQTEFASLPRVTDLDVDASSRLYLSSWKGAVFNYSDENVGYLVRLTPKGYQPEPLPDFARASQTELVKLLESSSHRRRLAAQRELIARKLESSTISALEGVASAADKPLASRVAAIFALKQALPQDSNEFLTWLADEKPVREYALRALTDRKDALGGISAKPIISAIGDDDRRVRRQVAVSLARLGKPEYASALLPLLVDADPVVAHTTVQALIALKAVDACFGVVDRSDAPPHQRAGALRVLQALHQSTVVDGLIERLAKEADSTRRGGLLAALCRLHYQEGVWKGNSWGTRPDTSGPYYQPEPWAESTRIAATLKAALASAGSAEAAALLTELNRNKIQLEGSLDTIVAMALKDPGSIPAAVGQLSRSPMIPGAAIQLLIRVARDNEAPALLRLQAVTALSIADDPDGIKAALAALRSLAFSSSRMPEYEKARDTFLTAPTLENHEALLIAIATKNWENSGAWADAALLTLSVRGSPEARATATDALNSGWADRNRRTQIIRAVALAKHRPYQDKVLEAANDSDKFIAKTAQKVVAEMRFVRPTQSSGPRIETMKTEAVVAAVLNEKGKVAVGEDLFTRMNCVKCHTVRQGEPLRGPYLGTIANTYKRRELAEAVLIPSKTIAQGFATNLFVLDDGRTLSGFVTQEAADVVTIRDIEGKEYQLPTKTIEDRSKQSISLMPEGLVKTLTVQEFASLLDYLQSLPKQ